jgi:hypothetical protein
MNEEIVAMWTLFIFEFWQSGGGGGGGTSTSQFSDGDDL